MKNQNMGVGRTGRKLALSAVIAVSVAVTTLAARPDAANAAAMAAFTPNALGADIWLSAERRIPAGLSGWLPAGAEVRAPAPGRLALPTRRVHVCAYWAISMSSDRTAQIQLYYWCMTGFRLHF